MSNLNLRLKNLLVPNLRVFIVVAFFYLVLLLASTLCGSHNPYSLDQVCSVILFPFVKLKIINASLVFDLLILYLLYTLSFWIFRLLLRLLRKVE